MLDEKYFPIKTEHYTIDYPVEWPRYEKYAELWDALDTLAADDDISVPVDNAASVRTQICYRYGRGTFQTVLKNGILYIRRRPQE